MPIDVLLGRGLRAHVDAPARVRIDGDSVRAAIDALLLLHPQLGRFILDDADRLRRHVNIFINHDLIHDRNHLSDAVSDGDLLHILPAVSGGN